MLIGTSNPEGAVFGLFLLLVVAALYFLPVLIAQHRGRENTFMIGLLNLLLGWTVLGWIVLFIIAFIGKSKADRDRENEHLRLLREIAKNGGNPPPL